MLKKYEPAVGRSLFMLDLVHLSSFSTYQIQVTLIQYGAQTLVSNVAEIQSNLGFMYSQTHQPSQNNAV